MRAPRPAAEIGSSTWSTRAEAVGPRRGAMEITRRGPLEPVQPPFALVESKLSPPRLREGTIPRPDLVTRLRPKPPANISLVVAPAGYGKTTLLHPGFAHLATQPVAWLSVDERDNDPVTLLTYLALALHRIGVCDRQLVEVLARPRRSLSTMVARLQRSVQASCPFTLLVDDLHLVDDE